MVGQRSRSCEDTVEALRSMEPEQRLQAIRDVKNQIIGNRTRKVTYINLGAIPLVADILATDTESALLVQSAATIGSFACGVEDGVKAVIGVGAVPHLLKTLLNKDEKVVEAGARSLKMIFQSPLAPKAEMFAEGALELMMRLLASSNDQVAEVAAAVLARCCETKDEQSRIVGLGAFPGLLRILSSHSARGQEAALAALAALTRDNATLSSRLLEEGLSTDQMLKLAKDKDPRRRIYACMILANVSGAGAMMAQRVDEIGALVLPTVVKLLGEGEGVGDEAPRVLASLIRDNEELQLAAADADAINKLAHFLKEGARATARLRESTLLALGALCSVREESRRQLVAAGSVPAIVRMMEDEDAGVRAAACLCAKSLSRSVKNLREVLVETPVVDPLLRLLSDSDPSVQASASATLCNMVLEFSPMKDKVLQAGGVQKLAVLARSSDPALRLNSMWALRNMLYHADSAVKETVLRELSWPMLSSLLHDPEVEIQEQALNLLRNLVHGSPADIDRVLHMEGGGGGEGGLLRVAAGMVRPGPGAHTEVCVHALYTFCNIACGSEEHKAAVMTSGIIEELPKVMADPSSPEVRVAAVWVVINLTYRGKAVPGAGVRERVMKLREIGVEEQLTSMAGDTCVNVKDRVKTALEQLRSIPP